MKNHLPVSYPTAEHVIHARAKQIYGSLAALGRQFGLSRAVVHNRMVSATRWTLTHKWWAMVLFIDPHDILKIGEAFNTPIPSDERVAAITSKQKLHWEEEVFPRRCEWRTL